MSRIVNAFAASLAGIALIAASQSSVAETPSYVSIDLGMLGGTNGGYGAAINAYGQVAGSANFIDHGEAVATGRRGNGAVAFGFGGPTNYAVAINSAGNTVGINCDYGGDCYSFFRSGDGEVMQRYITPQPGESFAVTAIGDTGAVAGDAYDFWGTRRPAAGDIHSGKLYYLSTLGGASGAANGINASGEICGVSTDLDGTSHVVIWDSAGVIHDTGLAGGAFAINSSGQLAGYGPTSQGNWLAFVTGPEGVGLHFLDNPPNIFQVTLEAINASGQVVGYATGAHGLKRAVVSDANGTTLHFLDSLTDLPDGVQLSNAPGINDRGVIVANTADGHVYELVPKRVKR